MVSLPLLRISDSKALAEDFPHSFQWHTFALGVEENNKYPTKETDSGIESKCTTRRPAFHHREVCRRDNDITAPAGNGVLSYVSIGRRFDGKEQTYQHGTHGSNLQWNQFHTNPGDRGDTR